jgi:UDP-N-acetylmuramoyl-tripeptide--D-alanyl-D-alanine ligase
VFSAKESHRVRTQFVGTHWVPSVTGALATARACGVPLADAVQAVRHVPPFKGRMQPAPLPNGATILRDEFNGSFDTMVRAIEVLQRATAKRRVAVISDCSDLKKKPRERLKYLSKAMRQSAEVVVFVGEIIAYGAQYAIRAGMLPQNVHHFLSLQDAEDFLRGELKAGDLVLLKGRASDHLSRIDFALLGTVECQKLHCSLRTICDECSQLGARPHSASPAAAPADTRV